MLYLGFKILKMTKCKNLRLTLLVIFINLTILSDLITQWLLTHIVNKKLEDPFHDGKGDSITAFYQIMRISRDVIFQTMIVINLNNWAYYTILIQEQTDMKKCKLGVA